MGTEGVLSIPKPILRLTNSSVTTHIKKEPMYSMSFLMQHAGLFHKQIWSRILTLDHSDQPHDIFNQAPYSFYHQIRTDGFSCSLVFILAKYQNRKHGQRIKLSDQSDQTQMMEKENEFIQLKNLTKTECDQYLTGKYKFASQDPGEIDPISMINDQHNFYQYSACQRRRETYTKRSAEILYHEKQKCGINQLESKLTKNPTPRKRKNVINSNTKNIKNETGPLPS